MENDQLTHHGILGMKWGVRRYKNSNGGSSKKRYRTMSDDAKEASIIKKKKTSQMTNNELKKFNERTRLEQEYSRLNPSKIKKGLTYVAGTAAIMGTAVSMYNNGSTLVKAGKNLVTYLKS